ncbi:MAG TPA: hypothetical protein VGR31_04185 [Planctomycetota bacterium]|nr:hypothetical protein [Planctomycetota bacterium]
MHSVFRAGFAAQWGAGAWPAAPLIVHGGAAAVLCGLTSDVLPPFAYGVFALAVCGALIVLPLLGDFGPLLRADAAAEWVEALPVTRTELRLARTMLVLFALAVLSLAALVPAAWFAPVHGLGPRLGFVAAGLAQSLFLAAILLGIQSILGERAEALLVLLQTVLVVGVVLGFAVGLRFVPRMIHLTSPVDAGLGWLPPAWFATSIAPAGVDLPALWRAAPWLAGLAALLVLAIAPLPRAPRARTSGGWIALLLSPLRALATRVWVRRAERPAFDLVFDALPLEREFVVRTYPMIGIPLAFLIAGSRGEAGAMREGLLAVLLFTPAAYLPILLVHVPATASHEARWILETSPLPRGAHDRGAIKAVALRFLLPLYALLFVLAWSQASFAFALRLSLPAALVSLILLRTLYGKFVHEPPLSVAPDAIEAQLDWTGVLAGLGVGLTLVAILAANFVTTVAVGLAVTAALIVVERALDAGAAKAA